MRALGFIPARGASRRFPRKNVAPLGGKPLLEWTMAPAVASGVFDAVVVSSEDAEILDVARRPGVRPLPRPPALAGDRVTIATLARHVVDELARAGERFDAIYVLTPTTPLRTPESIGAAWTRFAASDADALLSVLPMNDPPQWGFVVEGEWVRPWAPAEYERPRQELTPVYRHDGAHQIARTAVLLEQGRFVTDRTLAHPGSPDEAVDINWPIDLEWAEFLLSRRLSPSPRT